MTDGDQVEVDVAETLGVGVTLAVAVPDAVELSVAEAEAFGVSVALIVNVRVGVDVGESVKVRDGEIVGVGD